MEIIRSTKSSQQWYTLVPSSTSSTVFCNNGLSSATRIHSSASTIAVEASWSCIFCSNWGWLGNQFIYIYIYIYLCNIMQLEYEGPNFFLLQKLRPVQAAELASKDLAPWLGKDLEHHWPTPTMGAFDQLIVWNTWKYNDLWYFMILAWK